MHGVPSHYVKRDVTVWVGEVLSLVQSSGAFGPGADRLKKKNFVVICELL